MFHYLPRDHRFAPTAASVSVDSSTRNLRVLPTSAPMRRTKFAPFLTGNDGNGHPMGNGNNFTAHGPRRRLVSMQHPTPGAFLRPPSAAIASRPVANLHSMSRAMLADDIPSYISARSANSIISESRPTRIQAQTLAFLNRILDELLLFIVVSARSLATDRIKTDGLLKVLNNNVLAKDAVLEAELELRNYLQGKKAEGGRVPLGLSATSRWDGTEAFPVASAYMALRNRCQYYSTLGDREDDSVTGDQHIMSAEGRPIATITPGVSIYVTALLEFIGESILQNVARVIERDNSDEAGLADLKAAIEEDEALITMWRQMVVKQQVEKEMKLVALGSDRRVTRPWKVPEGSDYDEAATPARFRHSTQQRPGTAQGTSQPPAHWASNDRVSSSVSGHGDYYSESHSGNSLAGVSSATPAGKESYSSTVTTPPTTTNDSGPSQSTPVLTRRGSVDKGFSGLFSGRRRSSLRGSEDSSGYFAKQTGQQQPQQQSSTSASSQTQHGRSDSKAPDISAEPLDDFEALMMSGQTMKVSLTPNRLRTIEVARQEAEAKKARQRPGTLNVNSLRSDVAAAEATSATTAGGRSPFAASPDPSVSTPGEAPRPTSRNSFAPSPSPSMGPRRSTGRVSNPPSSYRGPDPPSAGGGASANQSATSFSAADNSLVQESQSAAGHDRMAPRDKRASWSAARDMMDLFNTTPPSSQVDSQFSGPASSGLRNNAANDRSIGKSAGMGGKMRALLGRRSNPGSKDSPFPGMRSDSRQSQASNSTGVGGGRPSEAWSDQVPDQRGMSTSSNGHGHGRAGSSNGIAGSTFDESALAEEANSLDGPPTPSKDSTDLPQQQREQKHQEQQDALQRADGGEDTPALGQTPTFDSALGRRKGNAEDTSSDRVAAGVVGTSATMPPAVMGLYDERKSPTGSGSALEDSRPEGPPSRKIPYGRRASRDGAFAINRLGSQRSNEGAVHDRANGTSSALGYATPHFGRSPAITPTGSRSVSANDPTSHSQSPPADLRRRDGERALPSTATTLQVLANLDRQMKLATSVSECQALVAEALNDALRGGGTSASSPDGQGDSIVLADIPSKQDRRQVAPVVASARPTPVLVMSNSYDEDFDETSAAYKNNGIVAAWLLEESFEPNFFNTTTGRDKVFPAAVAVGSLASPSDSSGSHLDVPDGGFRTRKLSSSTTLDDNAYASADEGDVEDEYESSATEGLLSDTNANAGAGKVRLVGKSPTTLSHPPSASAAALRIGRLA